MKKQFVTVTAGDLDWTAEDWKCAWADVLKKLDNDILIDYHNTLSEKEIKFSDWSMWVGVDPACDVPICVIEKEWNSPVCPCPMSAVGIAHLKIKQELAAKDKRMVKDGKTFINSHTVDMMVK